MKRVVFDLETEPFSSAFAKASSYPERLSHAPRLRVGCAFLEETEEYRYYESDDAKQLIYLLLDADEVVSFNGKHFDLLVLARHHGLAGALPRGGVHVDLCELLSEQVGFNVSLDLLAKINFGERKHAKGREMKALNLEGLKEACRSDVEQTYRLWRLWSGNKILLPAKAGRVNSDEYLGPGPGEHLPKAYPNCGALDTLEFLEDPDPELMSDGQSSDYEAGLWGSMICVRCGVESDYGF